MSNEPPYTELFDKQGNLIGSLITADLWTRLKPSLDKELGIQDEPAEKPEPIADWETLQAYWDFTYPVDTDVHCEACGNSTENWAEDEPRKFRMTSATLGGLVTFHCNQCRAKITKKHFKDKIQVECAPFQEAKQSGKEGRY